MRATPVHPRFLMLCFGLFLAYALHAQALQLTGESAGANVIVLGTSEDPESPTPVFQAVWRGVPGAGAVFQIQRTAAPDDRLRLMLDRLMEAGIGAYLDARVHFTKQGVVSDVPSDQLADEIDAMVRSAAEDLGVPHAFDQLSEPTRMQLSRLTHIDWSQARYGVDAGEDQDKYLAIYFYVRSQREELERQLRADLLPLASVAVLGNAVAEPGSQVWINSTCGTVFDEENYLCALDLQLADTGGGGIDPALGQRLMQAMAERSEDVTEDVVEMPRLRKRDRWLKVELDGINERIDRMDQRRELWAIRDRLDDIEDRVAGLTLEVRDVRSNVPEEENPSANLSDLVGRNITVRFDRNSTQLNAEYRVLLNEVFEQLARSSIQRVLVTGYSDRTGDPDQNLLLSELRAHAVRNYLMQRGISAERLLVNYYGDSRSSGRDPSERRVELEWIR
ncbi:MAG: OmpA family protein [Flavobacteriales bacterium]|nr:OmpA family protein [Flavobacteriales bacterium]MBK7618573.1 OmpA family protein [Flavobacteriales bacterium]MBP8879054.1 OmpA family protein [Flavobacteriales bacterium]